VTLKIASVLPIWILVAIASLIVALVTPGYEFFTWLPIVLAGSIVLTFCVQLAIRRKEGFNGRLNLSASGALIIVAVAALILWLVR
jgi:hypothetical protein